MIKIMNPALTLPEMLTDSTNGMGVLNPINGKVTERLNGEFEAQFTVSMTEKHFSDLQCGSVIQCKAGENNTQLFRVYKMSKPMNGIVTVYCRHITYDLNKAAVMPLQATGATAALNALKANIIGQYPFNVFTDITNTESRFSLLQPVSFRAALGGTAGSILDVFGGEYEFDNLTVKLLAHRGSDYGVTIEYGKNLTDIKQEENIENVYTAVLGYATNAETTVVGSAQYAVETLTPKTKIIDFSGAFTPDDTISAESLNALAQAYIEQNNIGVPNVNITVKFQPLWQTEEYIDIARLERVKMGDVVTVKFPKLGVEAKAEVVETVWDIVADRYASVGIGNVKSTLASTLTTMIDGASEQVTNASSFLESYIASFTGLVANSLGLFKTVEAQADGSQKVYLHNRPERADSQYQWTFNSGGFFLSQDYGQTWSAGIDADGNAVFNSLAANEINALTINGSTVNGSVINGGKIYSGDMSWFPNTANEATMQGTNINIVTPQGVYNRDGVALSADAIRMETASNGIIWIEAPSGRIMISPSSIEIWDNSGASIGLLSGDIYVKTGGEGAYKVAWKNTSVGWVLGAA